MATAQITSSRNRKLRSTIRCNEICSRPWDGSDSFPCQRPYNSTGWLATGTQEVCERLRVPALNIYLVGFSVLIGWVGGFGIVDRPRWEVTTVASGRANVLNCRLGKVHQHWLFA